MVINMEKRVQAAAVSLTKMAQADTTPDLGDDVTAQITLEVDASTSMASFYWQRHLPGHDSEPSTVQEIVERCLALSMTGLDADKTVPVTFYAADAWAPIEVHEDDYDGVVARWQRSNSLYPATRYAPAIRYALSVANEADERNLPPNLHLFVTDGEPSDRPETERLLLAARTRPHFFQFVVVGRDPGALRYMNRLNNDLTGPGLDNVGVFHCPDPADLSDEEFFDGIVNEFFPKWLPAARAAGYTK